MITMKKNTKEISEELYNKLTFLGIIGADTRTYNIGTSNYSQRTIQPWSVWIDWNLDPWDADIIKRVSREKLDNPRKLDYQKIIHICEEKIRQLDLQSANRIM